MWIHRGGGSLSCFRGSLLDFLVITMHPPDSSFLAVYFHLVRLAPISHCILPYLTIHGIDSPHALLTCFHALSYGAWNTRSHRLFISSTWRHSRLQYRWQEHSESLACEILSSSEYIAPATTMAPRTYPGASDAWSSSSNHRICSLTSEGR